ncbi:MAG: BON domain-containing protein [Methyloprofundus sp.]|nr:BON domain-containing protein [Methyloprofundus sp.]
MNKVLIVLSLLVLTACNSSGIYLAEMTGLSLLHDRRDSNAIALDERIEDTAIVKLRELDDVYDYAHFNVTSYNGKVLLTGEAATEAILKKIIYKIRIIPGVKIVHNEIMIGASSSIQLRTEDSLLTIKVKEAIAEIKDLPGFDATRVKVVTERQNVYLMGIVHEQEGLVVAQKVQKVIGVRKVVAVFEYINYANRK